MRFELASQLKITTYQEFSDAISSEIKVFIESQEKLSSEISNDDQKAIAAIREYLARENTSGEILRQDLKTILRDIYGYFGRFRKSLPRRLEALRIKTEFMPSALRRGDAQAKHPTSQMLQLQQQLQTERSEKEAVLHELKKLSSELKASTDEQLILMEDNAALEKKLILKSAAEELQKRRELELFEKCEALRALLLQAGISIPSHLLEPMPSPSRTISEHDAKNKHWSWKKAEQGVSPTVFKKDALSKGHLPLPSGLTDTLQPVFS